VVGYSSLDVATPYWIVQNSWGSDWGDQGYVYIEITDGDGICGINMDVTFPNLLMEPTSTTYWCILSCMFFAVLIVPLTCIGLKRAVKLG
jgi:hypothetical protein